MDWNTPHHEVESHRHAVLPDSHHYKVVRAVYDFDQEAGQNTITLTLVHPTSLDRRQLRFEGVISEHPLQHSLGIYIVDTSYRQWDRDARIEVGEYFEDGGVFFLAKDVKELNAEGQWVQ